jgi:hypothetical protein
MVERENRSQPILHYGGLMAPQTGQYPYGDRQGAERDRPILWTQNNAKRKWGFMKAHLVGLALLAIAPAALADQWVNGYMRTDGTFVPGHFRSTPNNTKADNYSTKGNVNPYTGEAGYVNPYTVPQPYTYTPPKQYQPERYQPNTYQPYTSYQPYQPYTPYQPRKSGY